MECFRQRQENDCGLEQMNGCRRGKRVEERLGAACQKRDGIANVSGLLGWSDKKTTYHVGARQQAFCIQPTTAQGGQGPEPPTRPSMSGQSIGVGYVHRMKRHCGANPHVGEFAACVCVVFACIARVMAARWKMKCRRETGGLLLKQRPHSCNLSLVSNSTLRGRMEQSAAKLAISGVSTRCIQYCYWVALEES